MYAISIMYYNFSDTAGSVVDNVMFIFTDCYVSVTCVYPESNGSCCIQYGQDPSYQDLSPPIQSLLNSSTTLPLLEPNTVYYSLAAVTINSSLIFQLQRNFTVGECETKPTSSKVLVSCISLFFSCSEVVIF